jgi:hypothetical protein
VGPRCQVDQEYLRATRETAAAKLAEALKEPIMLFNWTPGNLPADLAAEVTARCSMAMDRYTLPFLWQIDPTIKQAGQYGSGVLLQVSGRRFLVTSAHTMDEIVVKDLPTYFPGKEGQNFEFGSGCE